MSLSIIKKPKGSNISPKRVGRGVGSGMDKTSGRGHKGAKARSGPGVYQGFEGGQMPLLRRIPKRGFNNRAFAEKISEVNVGLLAKMFSSGDEVTPEVLIKRKLAKKRTKVKLLGKGEIDIPLKVRVHKASFSAIEKVKSAGGQVELIE